MFVLSSWSVLAYAGFALAFVAFVVTMFSIVLLLRMRHDLGVMQAAERFEAVNLGRVIKRYVPSEQQNQRFTEEIAVARQVVGVRQPRWKRAALASGLLLVCGVGIASYGTQRHLKAMELARATAKPRLNLDVLQAIEGVWGWQADYMQSCQENPQTISVEPGHKRLSVRYAKPHEDGPSTILAMEFEIVAAKPDSLELTGPVSASPSQPPSTDVHVQFLSANSFSISRGDRPMASSGTIARCPAQAPDKSATR